MLNLTHTLDKLYDISVSVYVSVANTDMHMAAFNNQYLKLRPSICVILSYIAILIMVTRQPKHRMWIRTNQYCPTQALCYVRIRRRLFGELR